MKVFRVPFFLVFVTLIMFISCSKTEGPGGSSTIYGQVWAINYNYELTNKLGEHWAQEEDVYIMYGNDTIPSDDVKTGYNGTYWFQFLQEGEYTIYVMSEDTTFTHSSGKYPVKTTVTISENGETIEAPLLTIVK